MYSLKAVFTQEPSAIVAVLMLGLNLLAITHVVQVTAEQLAAVNAFLLPAFNLFYVRPLTASKSALNELTKGE